MPDDKPPQDLRDVVHSLLRANRELAEAVEKLVAKPAEPVGFVPNELQQKVLEVLKGKALRTNALAAKVGDRRALFREHGGLAELQEEGLLANHPRVGYYRPDDPPPEIRDKLGDVSP